MIRIEGKSICKKVTMGKIFFLKKEESIVRREKVENIEKEKKQFDASVEEAREQLLSLYEKAKREVGEAEAAIFEVHTMMLEDQDYKESIYSIIENQQVCAEFAVAETSKNFSRMFRDMNDDYMKERGSDIEDISNRIIRILGGEKGDEEQITEPVIIMAKDLAPSETVQLNKEMLLGFVTEKGSVNSHTAILARTMNIPALINTEIREEWHGEVAIIDGYKGELIINPDSERIKKAYEQIEEDQNKERRLKELKGKESITKSGRKVNLYANIGNVADTGKVLQNDGEGIGLFRSEFLYLEAKDFPTEEEQFTAYKAVAENMAGKKVIIRTLDIGADKQVDYFHLEKEENPALGYRAIRICLKEQEMFKTQLRAILRASAFGNISIMFPMIVSVEELRQAKELLEEAKRELEEGGIPFKEIETGVMIETPAAVIISDELGKEADFFSIGTNDLTQYTLAADRQNPMLDESMNPRHPAVLKMIEMTAESAHRNHIWVGICGELGADIELTETFLKYGIDELSVSPSRILEVREKIRSLEY
ncbi:phosphotransferase system enzyme I (PtsI) [Aequitasia blattaphilus]|uniref:Phosphoenolpyruvate-protein phosphotransferase n=1 Tax=Aequitasia blattaphilus TaxID=2949332 RepID=A0ABT1E6I0_9FIRM|nr:phosphoenolpyruvate--protein phosphotransferase [Aequitasia blattaphilus]MCP1101199.1 phosphoenolpyruvate--protein phosphotransferase [Aequitasia blattaphilus]MCR8613839.1 phosphoenolpyruvate--protein phosphotransferase [Aequitasia blattaphilus]